MRTFAQKQNQPQQQASLNLSKSSAATSLASQEIHSILHLQRTIGNRAVLRFLHKNRKYFGTDPDLSQTTGLSSDLSWIPMHKQFSVQNRLNLALDAGLDSEADELGARAERAGRDASWRAAPGVVQGKRSIQAAPAEGAPAQTARAIPPELLARAGTRITDDGKFTYLIQGDGTFWVTATPPGFEHALGRLIAPTGEFAAAWSALCAKVVAKMPTAPGEAAPTEPIPASVAPAAGLPFSLADVLAGMGDA